MSKITVQVTAKFSIDLADIQDGYTPDQILKIVTEDSEEFFNHKSAGLLDVEVEGVLL